MDVAMIVLRGFPKAKPAWASTRRLERTWKGTWGSLFNLTSIHVHLRHASHGLAEDADKVEESVLNA